MENDYLKYWPVEFHWPILYSKSGFCVVQVMDLLLRETDTVSDNKAA